ncbi:MAG: 3-hydroxyacyl-CoA dehydrogenase family protein, partial [Gaiellales bacterium]
MSDAICVVGAGQMGSGIAQVAAVAGFDVTLVDVEPKQLARALSGIEASLAKLVEKGKVDADDAGGALGRIATAAEPGPADIAIEAATEDVDLKLRIFAGLDRAAGDGAVLASNTSSIPITRLAAATSRPERVVGMHFMNPVPLMPLVELIRGL